MGFLGKQFPPNDFALLAIVLLAPLIGAFVNGLFGRRLGKEGVRTMALAVMGIAFAASLMTFAALVSTPGHEEGNLRLTWHAWEWFSLPGKAGPIPIDVTFSADALSATMMLIVTGIGFLIHLYSTEYMAHDEGFWRFFAYLNLFVFSMLVLILGDNLAVLFVGWEGVGLCSYLLIGFWYTDEKKAAAGKKAFITNRIGDFGLLVAMALLLYHAGTLQWDQLETVARGLTQEVTLWPPSREFIENVPLGGYMPLGPWRVTVVTLVGFFLFLGCMGKSAQIPLYVWLPDAMAGPTPVSALIHAATMVTAGVYLVARLSFVFVLSPATMALIACTGAATALLAASIAFAQTDLKKVLAYSTVSQLGFMFIGVGVGAFAAGFFHVITHAFFKGCLFLCAGSVIHSMHARIHTEEGSQDMRNMGGLKRFMPVTHATFLVSCLAIAGMPFTSGFFSKDELLYKAYTSQITAVSANMWSWPPWLGKAIYAVGALAALGTAFYMFRAYFLTFWGTFRGWTIVDGWEDPHAGEHHDDHDEHHDEEEELEGAEPHESPLPMTVPLMVLAFFAAFGGLVFAEPLYHFTHVESFVALEHLWHPVFETAAPFVTNLDEGHAMLLPLLAAGSAIFVVGAGAAYWVYVIQRGEPAAQFVKAVPWLHKGASEKWYVDEAYEAFPLGLISEMGNTAAQFDRWVIDGVIAKLTATVARLLGTLLRTLQTGRVQVYAAGIVIGTTMMGLFLFQPHADIRANTEALHSDGKVVFEAAPGHGYQYFWRVGLAEEGVTEPAPEEFSAVTTKQVNFRRCETKTVSLQVRNVFGRVSEKTMTYCRETQRNCCFPEGEMPPIPELPPGLVPSGLPIGPDGQLKPGTYGPDVIKKLLNPGGAPAPAPSGGK